MNTVSEGGIRATLPLLLPQPQPRRVAIGELDAGLFRHALDRREIVRHRSAADLLEIDGVMFVTLFGENGLLDKDGFRRARPLLEDYGQRNAKIGE
jgi:hypothetical protein